MDMGPLRRHRGSMDRRAPLPDEVHGARAVGSLVLGDIGAAESELALTGVRYLAGFHCRLAVIVPSVA